MKAGTKETEGEKGPVKNLYKFLTGTGRNKMPTRVRNWHELPHSEPNLNMITYNVFHKRVVPQTPQYMR